MIRQTTFHLSAKRRGCHLVTQEILEHLPKPLPQVGMLNLFVQHTSCALSINENYHHIYGDYRICWILRFILWTSLPRLVGTYNILHRDWFGVVDNHPQHIK